MKKYIHVTKENREGLVRIFGVSDRMVWNALTFDAAKGGSDLAKRIRKAALERGGIVMVEVPEVETLHDADGYIRQYLPNGAMLEIGKDDGRCVVLFRGERVREFEDVPVRQLEGIQEWAMTLR